MKNGLAQIVVVVIIFNIECILRFPCCSAWVDTPFSLVRLQSHNFPRQRCLLGESCWHPDTNHEVAYGDSLTSEKRMLQDMNTGNTDNTNLLFREEEFDDGTNKYSWTDEEFEAWILSELSSDPLAHDYPEIFSQVPRAITNWRKRYRGNQALWRRIFTRDRVFKEFLEAVPIIDAVVRLVAERKNERFTIVDLASGKGYLSMLLSELLPSEKVTKFILVDKAWPMCNSEPSPHHMSWEHIYGNKTETESYFDTWPIPLHTSKQDLKKSYNMRQLKKRLFDPAPGPIIILAVHLCGTLSLRAVDMFNNHDNVCFFALKPCCLPAMTHVERDEIFQLGNHTFDSKLVCAPGKWSKKQWYGPPRWHLEPRFEAWVENLFLGVCGASIKRQTKVVVQHDGGFQNAFIFAERMPTSSSMWLKIDGK